MTPESHDVIGVIGMRGSGKTTWARDHIVDDVLDYSGSVLLWDPHMESETYHDLLLYPDEMAEYLDRYELPPLSAVVPHSFTPQGLREGFSMFVEACTLYVRDTCIVIDEVALLRRAPDLLDALVTQSRHWDCPVVLISQRAAAISKTSRAQISYLVSFAQRDPDDIKALCEIAGQEAAIVKDYNRYQYFLWSAHEALTNRKQGKEPET